LWAFTTYVVVVVAVSTTKAIVVGHLRAAVRMFIPTKSISPRQPLDLGVVSIECAAGGEELIVKNPTYAWGDDVPETSLHILVNTGCESMETKVRREVATVVFLHERVHMQLEGSDSIRIFQVLHCPQEHPAASAIVVVEVRLGLQAKEKEKCLGNLEDILDVRPKRGMNWDCWIKPGTVSSITRHM